MKIAGDDKHKKHQEILRHFKLIYRKDLLSEHVLPLPNMPSPISS